MNKDNYKEKTMNKYSNGKIYQIESNVGNKIYIGSTVKKLLCDRMSGHRYDYKRWKNGNKQRIYKSFEMFDEYGLENCKIVLIENYPCNSRDELTSREAHYIRTMTCVNRYIPDRSDEEYRNDPAHKERKKVVNKTYYESVLKQKNKEIIKCDCGCEIQQGYKSRHLKSNFHLAFEASKPV